MVSTQFDRSIFSERLRYLREEKGFATQNEFAAAVGISKQAVNYYESGKRLPDAETLYMLSECLECSVDWLLGRTENMMPDYAYIERITGLSDDAILQLETMYDNSFYARRNLILNMMITSGYIASIVDSLIDIYDRISDYENRHTKHKVELSKEEKNAGWKIDFLEHQKDSIIAEMVEYHAYSFSRDMDALRNEILACLSDQYGEAMIAQKEAELSIIREYHQMLLKDYGL